MKRLLFLLFALFFFLQTAHAVQSLCGERPATAYHELDWFGGTGFTVAVTAPANCTYDIGVRGSLGITVTSPATATGNSTITYNVSQNNSLAFPRVGVILVGNKTITINQGRAEGAAAKRVQFDFNGDSISDYVAIQNQSNQMIWWRYSFHFAPGEQTSAHNFGLWDQDIPVSANFDSDFKCDFAVWRPGPTPNSQAYFIILRSAGNFVEYIPWGITGDDPTITQDFDGDLLADPAVVRKENGKLVWYVKLSATGGFWGQQFGNDTDKPIRGDFDGDFHADLAVYRPNTGSPANTFFWVRSSDDTATGRNFGLSDIDKIVPADFDGDGATDLAVWRTTTGDFHSTPASGGGVMTVHWGQPGDLPIPGEFNSTHRDDYVVWRPGNPGVFYTMNTDGTPHRPVVHWGNADFRLPAYTTHVK